LFWRSSYQVSAVGAFLQFEVLLPHSPVFNVTRSGDYVSMVVVILVVVVSPICF
jgi:hypothetical protein